MLLGDDSAMLFTLSPAMRCFNTTGYNDHYQYLNLSQQTMPNGLVSTQIMIPIDFFFIMNPKDIKRLQI